MSSVAPRRLNCGCGPDFRPGWLHCDRSPDSRAQVRCDLVQGLPFAPGAFEAVAAIHVLQDLPWVDVIPALRELRRVLDQGGVLRVGVPDVEKAVHAWQDGDARWFHVPDQDARLVGAKFITQLIWYGSVRTPFNFAFLSECLERAGYSHWTRCPYRHTASDVPDVTAFDNRERESLFVEAYR